jgi:hypothetical protein
MKKTLLLTFGLLAAAPVWAGVPADLARRAIVGEAAGCPYLVKLGVACAIRNRGTLKGVYGLNARHNATEPAWVWNDAAKAWRESARHDVTRGANHFGNADDVRKGTFKGMKLTVVLGEGRNKTYFFKAA